MKGYLDAKELESYKKEDLQELAKQLGVDAEGTKKEIAARCAAVEVDIPDNSELTEEDKKVAAEAAAEAAAKAEEEKKAVGLVKVKAQRRFLDKELNQIKDTGDVYTVSRERATVLKEAVPKMLKAGADVLIEAQRAEAQAMGLNETGGFINSIKATDVKGDDTEKYVEIYPQGRAKHGNDRKGDKSKVRYATIGFVAEYGTSSHAARPYMTVANEKAHEKVVEAQRSIWESETGE